MIKTSQLRFGMVTEDTDVEELLELVISVGKRVQENSKVLDTMSEIVKKVRGMARIHCRLKRKKIVH